MSHSRAFAGGFLIVVLGATSTLGWTSTGCATTPTCTPADQGLANATMLSYRVLTTSTATDGACAEASTLVSTEAEFESARATSGAPAVTDTAVDFARERVVIRTGDGALGVAWAVAQNDVAYVGLLRCATTAQATCQTTFLAVSSIAVGRAETRTCTDAACGMPATR